MVKCCRQRTPARITLAIAPTGSAPYNSVPVQGGPLVPPACPPTRWVAARPSRAERGLEHQRVGWLQCVVLVALEGLWQALWAPGRSTRCNLMRPAGDPCRCPGGAPSDRLPLRQETVVLLLDHRVALATAPLKARPVEHGDVSADVLDKARPLQFGCDFGNPLPANAEHVGDEFLGHDELVALQSIQAQEEPSAKLLIYRVMAVAHGRLRHLGDERAWVYRSSKWRMGGRLNSTARNAAGNLYPSPAL